MEKTYSPTTQYNAISLQKMGWYKASTLAERLATLTTLRSSTSFPITEQARKRMQRWREQYVFKEVFSFAERLEMDSMTEEDLLALLALPSEVLRLAAPSRAVWLEELARAFETPSTPQDEPLPYELIEGIPSFLCFLRPVEPLLHRALARLREGINHLVHSYSVCPFDTDSVLSSLLANLVFQFRDLLARTLVLEMHVTRLQQCLQGETPEERFSHFVSLLCQGQIYSILEEYPVLARQLLITVEHWLSYGLEFLEHLCRDWVELCATFSCETNPGPLKTIQMGAGDTHREGRSVLLLQFHNGLQLVYKPKPLAIDVHFQELLAWLNTFDRYPPLALIKILDKGNYGWSEYIATHDCASKTEVQHFYERQGAYLALLHSLEATDFHAENIIAAGEHPIMIDLEALFHPDVVVHSAVEHPAEKALQHSVLRVGLLPHRIYASDESEGLDNSGFGGQPNQLTPLPVPTWEDAGTDTMHLTKRRREMNTHQNLPRLNGQEVALLDHQDAILTGFTAMYRLLMEQRDILVTEYLPRFCKDEIRVILRPTHFYVFLLRGSLHPNNTRDGLDRDRYLDRLFFDCRKWSQPALIVSAERAALLRGDIPMFTTHVDDQDLFTCQGERISAFFHQSGFLSVQTHIQQLSEQDLQRQLWFIKASFTSLLVEAHHMHKRQRNLPSSFVPATREHLLALASQVGKRLSSLAFRDDESSAGWLTLAHINKHEWSVQIAGPDLYDGATGIILFLAYLAKLTGEEQCITLAKAALQALQEALVEWKQNSEHLGIGAFQGLSSFIYLFSHLGVIWHEPALLDECETLIALLPALIEKDTNFDIISGAAGCILALLAVYRVTSSRSALTAAIQCGEHLYKHACKMSVGVGWKALHQETPLAGFSHGCAGIAYSLLALSATTGDERFKQTAQEALAYERTLYVPAVRNWLDLRESDEENKQENDQLQQKFMVAWCHGAPGIGLARLASLPYLDDATIREEIAITCQTTATSGFGTNHSLCHGAMGNIETLLVAARAIDLPGQHENVYRIAGVLLGENDTQDWITGVPIEVETPGLMTGLAGIGYELLRLAEPEKVPSVLLLAPPNLSAANDKYFESCNSSLISTIDG